MNSPDYPQKLKDFFMTAKNNSNKKLSRLNNYCEFSHTNFDDDDIIYTMDPDDEGKRLFEFLAGNEYILVEEVTEYAERYTSILVDNIIDDWGLPFNALIVDTSDESLPVYLIGFNTDGKLEKVSNSLELFVENFILEKDELPPEKAIPEALKESKKLLDSKSYEDLSAYINSTINKYGHILDLDDRQDNHLKRCVGGLYNIQGIAQKNLLNDEGALVSFEKSYEMGDSNALLNLMDYYCYESGEYEKARMLSRKQVSGDYAWYHKVKVDAFASLMLEDTKQAEYCYSLLRDNYFRRDNEKIEEVVKELKDLTGEKGASILQWFGVATEYSEKEKVVFRKWWNTIEINWQKQFRIILDKHDGADEREKAAKSTAQLSDDEILYIIELKKVKLNSDYPVPTLNPLTELKNLQSLVISQSADVSCLQEVKQFKKLKELDLAQYKINDISFVEEMSNLETLNLSGNRLIDLTFLENLVRLRELNVSGNEISETGSIHNLINLELLNLSGNEKIKDISPLKKLSKLILLDLEYVKIDNTAAISNMTELEYLDIELAETIENLNFLSKCKSLKNLTIKGEGIADISAISESFSLKNLSLFNCERLNDISIIKNLKELTKIDIVDCDVTDISPLAYCKNLLFVDAYMSHKKTINGILDLTKNKKLRRLELSRETVEKGIKRDFENKVPGVIRIR